MTDWREVKLGDLGKIITGKTPSTKVDTYWGKNIPFVTPKDIQGSKHILETERYLTDEGMLSVKGSILPPNTVCVSCIGNIGYVSMTTKKSVSNQQINSIIANDENDANFIYYLIKSLWPYFKSYEGQSTTVSILNKSQFSKISVNIPPLDVQRKIARVLGALDDKIELNNRINQNLEQQVNLLYKGLLNGNSLKEVSLSELMKYAGGSQPPASQFIYEQKEGYIRFVQIRDYETNNHVTYIPISKKNKICQEDDIMIARYGASLGRICFGLDGAYNVALAKVFPTKEYYKEFLRCYLSSDVFYQGINNRGNRSAQAGFNESDIRSFTLKIPTDEKLIRDFNNIACTFFEKRLYHKKENIKLQELRDTLLPKLMSGKINVDNVDISNVKE